MTDNRTKRPEYVKWAPAVIRRYRAISERHPDWPLSEVVRVIVNDLAIPEALVQEIIDDYLSGK